jgi:hypothetical protein
MKPGFTKVVLDWLYEVYISKLDSQKTGLWNLTLNCVSETKMYFYSEGWSGLEPVVPILLQENVSQSKAMTVVTDICFDGNSTLDRKWMTSVA